MIDKIKEKAKEIFDNDSTASHDWDHTKRVYNLCIHIGEKENADMNILKLAALLHDIGREEQNKSKGKICHAEIGAKLAKEILENHNFDNETISKVIHCIETHRYRNNKIPETKEAKILYDADKLDSIGAVGIGRAFHFSGMINSKLHVSGIDIENSKEYSDDDCAYREYLVKLKNIKDKLFTEEGKRIAEQRHNFMVEFFERLNREIDGEQ